jgi:hypothetical protein
MSERERTVDDDMWRTPVTTKSEDKAVAEEPVEDPADEQAYEDSWYQVLRGNVGDQA